MNIFEIENAGFETQRQTTVKYLKNILFLFLLSFSSHCYGQEQNIYTRWITDDSEFMLLDKKTAYISFLTQSSPDVSKSRHDYVYALHLTNDILTLKQNYYYSENEYSIENYYYRIILLNDSILILKNEGVKVSITDSTGTRLNNAGTKKPFNNKQLLKFVKQEYAVDTSIHFEKLCCYNYQEFENVIQISNDSVLYVQNQFLDDDLKYYEGKMNDFLYKELIHLLQTCSLQTMDWGSGSYSDTFEYVLIVDYNGLHKKFKSGHPPQIVQPLIHFLSNIAERVELSETHVKREIPY